MTICTVPLPKLERPSTTARPRALSPPLTISAALAESSSISTTTGVASASASASVASSTSRPSALRTITSSPCLTRVSTTAVACVSSPPELPRRSITTPLASGPSFSSAAWTCSPVFSWKVEMLR